MKESGTKGWFEKSSGVKDNLARHPWSGSYCSCKSAGEDMTTGGTGANGVIVDAEVGGGDERMGTKPEGFIVAKKAERRSVVAKEEVLGEVWCSSGIEPIQLAVWKLDDDACDVGRLDNDDACDVGRLDDDDACDVGRLVMGDAGEV